MAAIALKIPFLGQIHLSALCVVPIPGILSPRSGTNFTNTYFLGAYLNLWFPIPVKYNTFHILILSVPSSIPSSNYFKPLGHSSNFLLYLLFSADKNITITVLNSQSLWDLTIYLHSHLFYPISTCPKGEMPLPFMVPPSTSSLILILPEPYPSAKPHLLYSFNFWSTLAAFCLYICSHLFHIKMLTSLSLQSTFSK